MGGYVYCLCNPVKLVDQDGNEASTHTDQDGNVIAVFDDGDLGVYRHNKPRDAAINDVNENYSKQNTSANGEKVGETWTPLGFANFETYASEGKIKPGDNAQIDFNSNWGTDKVNEVVQAEPNAIRYALNAKSYGKWYFKTQAPKLQDDNPNVYYGSLLYGKYASARDVGNFAAGFIVADAIDPNLIRYGFGRYNEMNNKISLTAWSVMSDFLRFPMSSVNVSSTILCGENPLSRAGIEAGYNYFKNRK